MCPGLLVLLHKDKNARRDVKESFVYDVFDNDGDIRQHSNGPELRLAHLSVRDYLISGQATRPFKTEMSEVVSRAYIVRLCITYLFHLNHRLSGRVIRERFPFSQYCAKYWTWHARAVSRSDQKTLQRIRMLLSDSSEALDSWLCLLHLDDPWMMYAIPHVGVDLPPRKQASPLYYTALAGLHFATQCLLDQGVNVDAHGGLYATALQAASCKGHDKVVRILLEKGADINGGGGMYGNALQAASQLGHTKVINTLLTCGADSNICGREEVRLVSSGTPLQRASHEGHEKVVQILLDAGADVNARGGSYGHALQAAIAEGHNKIVQILLDRGADVNAQGGSYGNVLQSASAEGQNEIVRMLLDRGADVNIQGGYYRV